MAPSYPIDDSVLLFQAAFTTLADLMKGKGQVAYTKRSVVCTDPEKQYVNEVNEQKSLTVWLQMRHQQLNAQYMKRPSLEGSRKVPQLY